MPKLTTEQKRQMCAGCRDEVYHGSNNGCWMFSDAKPVLRREVHIDERPPWTGKPWKVLSCFHRPRFIYVDPKRTC